MKKGSARDVLFAAVILFIIALGFFAMNFGINAMFDGLKANPKFNATSNATNAIVKTQAAINQMDYMVIGVFFALVLGVFITGWMIGGVPIFMVIYFIIAVAATLLSALFSYVWKLVTSASVWGTTLANFPITNHVMGNLQYYIAAISVIGMIVMFAKPYFSGEGNLP